MYSIINIPTNVHLGTKLRAITTDEIMTSENHTDKYTNKHPI